MRLQEKCKRGAVMVRPRMCYVVQQTHVFSLTHRHANATRFALWGGAGRLIYSMSLWTACAGLSCHARVGPKLVLKQFDSLNSRTVDHVSKDRGIYSTSSGANRQSTMHEAISYHHFSLCKFSTELSCIACRTLGRLSASLQWRRRSPRGTGFPLAKRWMGSNFSGSGNSTEASSWP